MMENVSTHMNKDKDWHLLHIFTIIYKVNNICDTYFDLSMPLEIKFILIFTFNLIELIDRCF